MNTNQTIMSAPQNSSNTLNNTNSLQNPLSLDSATQQPNLSLNNTNISPPSNNSSSSFLSFFSSTTFKIIVVLILLAILGINVLRYLANTTDFVANNFSEGVIQFLTQTGILVKDTTKTITRKTKKGIKTTAKVVKRGLSNKKRDRVINNNNNNNNDTPEPNTSTGKWCFIGSDRGYGSCKKVDDSSRCMSGLLYPTQEECRNKGR